MRTTTPRSTAAGFLALAGAVAALLACCASRADAKAAYAGKAEMVRRSDAVAVVEVLRVEQAEVKGRYWTYSQRAVARVRKTLKGDLPATGKEVALFGGEDFICARCNFQPGKYVVFLQKDGGLWTGSNWHLSVRPVATDKDGKEWVDWYANDKSIELKATPLPDVLADVQKTIADAKAEK
jgi:hypothetical protein